MAPVLTIFIGGNHEASNYLQELPYGGWVAPNIYYMGENLGNHNLETADSISNQSQLLFEFDQNIFIHKY